MFGLDTATIRDLIVSVVAALWGYFTLIHPKILEANQKRKDKTLESTIVREEKVLDSSIQLETKTTDHRIELEKKIAENAILQRLYDKSEDAVAQQLLVELTSDAIAYVYKDHDRLVERVITQLDNLYKEVNFLKEAITSLVQKLEKNAK